MGFGGVTALGCTVGQGLSGVSTLAVGSFIAVAAIVARGCVGTEVSGVATGSSDCIGASVEKKFASQADVEEKQASFDKLSDHAYAYTAEGDPNTGIVIGDDAVMVIDTQATPVMAQDVIRRIREVTDKPIRYVVLSHYHAVRVLGASGYKRRAHHRQSRHV